MTSIEKARSVYGLDKRAGFNPVEAVARGTQLLFSLPHFAGAALLGIAAAGGIGTGLITSQLMAHDKESTDTVKKEYDNERLKADIGYLEGRISDEANAAINKAKPKAARVLG